MSNNLPSLLKQVILRIDFTPIPNFLEYARHERNTPELQEYFSTCREIKANNIELKLEPDTAPKFKMNETLPITRFAGIGRKFKQEAVYDLAPTFICLTITCDDKYESIAPYLQFINEAFCRLHQYESFVRIQRIGLRKIDSHDYDSADEGNKVFKSMGIKIVEKVDDVEGKRLLVKQNSAQHYIYESNKIELTSQMSFTPLPKAKKFRFTLDSDAFVNGVNVQYDNNKVLEYLSNTLNALNDYAYQNFKDNINLEYVKHRKK